MAVKKVYVDLDGKFVNTLLNWRLFNLTTAQRTQLGTQLGPNNIALPVYDTDENLLYIWTGTAWLLVGGGGTSAVWGDIIGTIGNQTDLISLFNTKANISSLATVAFSGSYNDLINKPVNPFGSLSTTGTTGASTLMGGNLNIPIYQGQITLSTSGTTGNATLIGNALNIPNYTAPSGYTLPPATTSTLGGVIVGANLQVAPNGNLSLQSSGVTGALGFTPYNASNPLNYISLTSLSAVTPLSYNNATGSFSILKATTSSYGVVEVGTNIGVSNGIISLQSSGVTGALGFTPVQSVFGRTGVVVAQGGDYNTSQVTENTNLYFTNARAIASTLTGYSSGAGTISSVDSILTAIQKLNGNTTALVTGVSSVFGRNGAVTAQSADYNTSQVTENTNLYFTNARAIGSTLTGYVVGSGNVTASDSILTAIEKLAGNAISSGVTSVSNSDGTLTISPTGGFVVASLNLSHANTWLAAQTHQDNGLGTTTAPFLTLLNSSAATATVTQVSPSLLFTGQGWKTTATAASQAVSFQQFVLPIQGAANPTGQWLLQQSINNAAFASVLTVNSNAIATAFDSNGLTIGTLHKFTNNSAGNGGVGSTVQTFLISNNQQNTSGTQVGFLFQAAFAPTAGTCTYNNLSINPTINQTSTASGITRAVYINPTLTSAPQFRALEIAAGITIFGASTTSAASMNIPTGAVPTTPNNGDMWVNANHFFIRLNGVTIQIV